MQSIKIRNFINSPPKPETHAIKKKQKQNKTSPNEARDHAFEMPWKYNNLIGYISLYL